MPISGTTTDYTGRKRDVCILHPTDLTGKRAVSPINFGSPSSFCAGVQKLIQRYMVAFLTVAGSQRDYPTFGTAFVSSLNGGTYNPSVNDVTHIFNFANYIVVTSFRNYQAQNPSDPLDEQIDTATLNSASVSGDIATFDILMTTRAGTTITFVMPLPL